MANSKKNVAENDVDNKLNLDDSYKLVEYCDEVGNSALVFRTQDCTSKDGKVFRVLAIPTDEKLADGRIKFCFFSPSKRLQGELDDNGEVFDDDYVAEHQDELRLLEPAGGLKFGIVYVEGNNLRKLARRNSRR